MSELDLENLISEIKTYQPLADTSVVEKAYHFAKSAHAGQKRLSGEPYFIHPLATARNLVELKLDPTTIAAGFLHDVVEDTYTTIEQIQKEFGKEIALLVEGVTNVGKIKLRGNREEIFLENMRKLFLVMAKDLRVVFIKLSDRLHNVETLKYVPEQKRKRIAQETLEIYAPLAERLGMGDLKGKLEDLSFPFVYPDEYKWVLEVSEKRYEETDRQLKRARGMLINELREANISAEVHGRKKHLYSLYRKLLLKDRQIDLVYDLVALRVLVNTVAECYEVLGAIHKKWKPLKGLIKDYISQPKPNGYQSLHTTVFGPEGKIFEVQIRTYEMHNVAEHGAAAHWDYSQRKSVVKNDAALDGDRGVNGASFEWVKKLASWQRMTRDSEEFKNLLKNDFFAGRIYVFSPKGDVYDLPKGATSLDFAFCVHSGLGSSCVGAKVNGRLVSLNTPLENADLVEIIKSKNQSCPKRDWLEIVVTGEAKRKIRSSLKRFENK